jgi:hypothetical protein
LRILTLGDSWTYGSESSDPATMSWPAQMSRKYDVEVVNLGRGGSSLERACRIGIEELCRDNNYDFVILPLVPLSRTEVLKNGKWYQVWPGANNSNTELDRIYTEFWMPWNDIQKMILQTLQFASFVKSINIPLYMCSLSNRVAEYERELSWITDYKNDNNFASLGMPLSEMDIGIADLDRKLKSLKAIHEQNLKLVPDYIADAAYLTEEYRAPGGHPNDDGYAILADYFAEKIGLSG